MPPGGVVRIRKNILSLLTGGAAYMVVPPVYFFEKAPFSLEKKSRQKKL